MTQKKKIEDVISFQIHKTLLQVFPEVCKYSCSGNNEQRNFVLVKKYYELKLLSFSIKVMPSIELRCDNCGWKARYGDRFARKIFKNGLSSHLLILFSKNRLYTSNIANFWASLWLLWTICLGIAAIITVVRFNLEPVERQVEEVSVANVLNNKYIGEIVTLKGRTNYTDAFIKQDYKDERYQELVKQEVYLPIYSEDNPRDFLLLKGGESDTHNALEKKQVEDPDLLADQKYEVTGRIELFQNISDESIRTYFSEELPKTKNRNPPKLIINSSDLKTTEEFFSQFIPYFVVIIIFLTTSLLVQIKIDKLITQKANLSSRRIH